MKVTCNICPHCCTIEEGHTGLCQARANIDGKIICSNYGQLTSIALDPIEKKPFVSYMPESMILSVGSYGCNLRCPFCQNHEIARADSTARDTVTVRPDELIGKAKELTVNGNIGIAYTYNEPLISYEYILDGAKLAHAEGLKVVLVTNGYINEQPLIELLPHVDAMNIDLKGFTDSFYRKLGGDLETVKRTVAIASSSCHVEVTTLIIPEENDTEEEIKELSAWLAGINENIPLHTSRFFPRHQYEGQKPTSVQTVYKLADIARENLKHVVTGNC